MVNLRESCLCWTLLGSSWGLLVGTTCECVTEVWAEVQEQWGVCDGGDGATANYFQLYNFSHFNPKLHTSVPRVLHTHPPGDPGADWMCCSCGEKHSDWLISQVCSYSKCWLLVLLLRFSTSGRNQSKFPGSRCHLSSRHCFLSLCHCGLFSARFCFRLDELRHRLIPLYSYDPAEQPDWWGEDERGEEEELTVS